MCMCMSTVKAHARHTWQMHPHMSSIMTMKSNTIAEKMTHLFEEVQPSAFGWNPMAHADIKAQPRSEAVGPALARTASAHYIIG